MTSDITLQQAITAFEQGEKRQAQRLLQQILRQDPHNQAAWLWLAATLPEHERQRECLEFARDIDPTSDIGQHAGRALASPGVVLTTANLSPSLPATTSETAPAAIDLPTDQPADDTTEPASSARPSAPVEAEPDNPTPVVIPTLPDTPTPGPAGWFNLLNAKPLSMKTLLPLLGSLVVALFGFLLVGIAIPVSQTNARVASLPVINSTALATGTPGQRVIVEGWIGQQNEQFFGSFFACELRERKLVRVESKRDRDRVSVHDTLSGIT
ncbi:MAG: tetratricopeptide repeat protein [Chloroflexaceae bacterium]